MVHSLDHAGFVGTWKLVLHWVAPGELLLLRCILLHRHRLDGGDQEGEGCCGLQPHGTRAVCCENVVLIRRTPPTSWGDSCISFNSGLFLCHGHCECPLWRPLENTASTLPSNSCGEEFIVGGTLPSSLVPSVLLASLPFFCSSLFYKQSFAFYTFSLNHFWKKKGGGKESYFFYHWPHSCWVWKQKNSIKGNSASFS